MTLFDDDDQFHPSIIYDFDLLASYDQKKNFIEKVFEEERILCRCFIGDESERIVSFVSCTRCIAKYSSL